MSGYRGALTLASPEVKFEIDTETHDPLDVGMYQVREANQMVEEMMLLANITVAEHILRHFPAQALLRRHPVPPPRQFDPLLKAAVAAGVSINPETSQVGFYTLVELVSLTGMLVLKTDLGQCLRIHIVEAATHLPGKPIVCRALLLQEDSTMSVYRVYAALTVSVRVCRRWQHLWTRL